MPRKTDPNGNPLKGASAPPQKRTVPRYVPKSQVGADWSEVEPSTFHRLIVCVTAAGDAIRFGYTSDGGALVLALISDPPTPNIYLKPSDDVEATLLEIIEAYGNEK